MYIRMHPFLLKPTYNTNKKMLLKWTPAHCNIADFDGVDSFIRSLYRESIRVIWSFYLELYLRRSLF